MSDKHKKLELNDVLNTPFYVGVLLDFNQITTAVRYRNGFVFDGNNHRLLKEAEKKKQRLFYLISSLTDFAGDLHTIYALMNRAPPKRYLDKNDISKLHYLKYHYEVFIHKVHTICELLKLVANEVFDIGLIRKDCNWKNLIAHQEFSKSKCRYAIQRYYDDFKGLIEHRHKNTHQGVYNDEEMNEVSTNYNLYRMSDKFGVNTDDYEIVPRYIVEYQVKEFKKTRLQAIRDAEQLVFLDLQNFFNSLS